MNETTKSNNLSDSDAARELDLAIRNRNWKGLKENGGRWLAEDPHVCLRLLLNHWGHRPGRLHAFFRNCRAWVDGVGELEISEATVGAVEDFCRGEITHNDGRLSGLPAGFGKIMNVLIDSTEPGFNRRPQWQTWYRLAAAERTEDDTLFAALQPSPSVHGVPLNTVGVALFSKPMRALPGLSPAEAELVFRDALQRRMGERITGRLSWRRVNDFSNVLCGGAAMVPAGCLWDVACAWVDEAGLDGTDHNWFSVSMQLILQAPGWARACVADPVEIEALIVDAIHLACAIDDFPPHGLRSKRADVLEWLDQAPAVRDALRELLERSPVNDDGGRMISEHWLDDAAVLELVANRPDWLEDPDVLARHSRMVLQRVAHAGSGGVVKKI